MALTSSRCSSSLALGCAAAKGMAGFLLKSLQLYAVVVTKSWKLLKPFMDSMDSYKGKNLCNSMYDHMLLKERGWVGFMLRKLTELVLVEKQNDLLH